MTVNTSHQPSKWKATLQTNESKFESHVLDVVSMLNSVKQCHGMLVLLFVVALIVVFNKFLRQKLNVLYPSHGFVRCSDALGYLMKWAAVLGWLFGSSSLSHCFLEAARRQAVRALSGWPSCCLSTYRKQVPGLPHIQFIHFQPRVITTLSLIWCHFDTT